MAYNSRRNIAEPEARHSSLIQTYPEAYYLQSDITFSDYSTILPGNTVGTVISTVHAFRLADYTADRDSHPALKICRCKFIIIYNKLCQLIR